MLSKTLSLTEADPEANLGGGGSRGSNGKGRGGGSPLGSGSSVASPCENFEKNEAKECKSSLLKSLKLSFIYTFYLYIAFINGGSSGG